jgi:hypothetical protein
MCEPAARKPEGRSRAVWVVPSLKLLHQKVAVCTSPLCACTLPSESTYIAVLLSYSCSSLRITGKIGFIEFSLISRTYFLESTVPSSTRSLFSELGAPTVPLTCTKGRSPSSGISVDMGISTMISRSEHEDSKGAMRSRRLRAPAAGGGKRANSFCLRQLECSASFVPYGWES